MQNETVIVLDFGGQYNQLIARRVRECNVYCEVMSYKNSIEKIKEKNPVGIIFTGGPNSVYAKNHHTTIYFISSSVSPLPTPRRTSKPSSIFPFTLPSILTSAFVTLCTTALICHTHFLLLSFASVPILP